LIPVRHGPSRPECRANGTSKVGTICQILSTRAVRVMVSSVGRCLMFLNASRRHSLERAEQVPGLDQVRRLEALGEPAVDRSEKITGLGPLAFRG
jgi:hypothetical protein